MPIRLNVVSATAVVDTSTPLADLPCQAVLGGLGGSEENTDLDKVFLPDGRCLSDLASSSAFGFVLSVFNLILKVTPVPRPHVDWRKANLKPEEVLQGGGDGSLAFKQKLARSILAECLVRLAQRAALFKESEGCVLAAVGGHIQQKMYWPTLLVQHST